MPSIRLPSTLVGIVTLLGIACSGPSESKMRALAEAELEARVPFYMQFNRFGALKPDRSVNEDCLLDAGFIEKVSYQAGKHSKEGFKPTPMLNQLEVKRKSLMAFESAVAYQVGTGSLGELVGTEVREVAGQELYSAKFKVNVEFNQLARCVDTSGIAVSSDRTYVFENDHGEWVVQ